MKLTPLPSLPVKAERESTRSAVVTRLLVTTGFVSSLGNTPCTERKARSVARRWTAVSELQAKSDGDRVLSRMRVRSV